MAVPEGLHQSNRIKLLNWLTRKRPPNTFQWLISRLANQTSFALPNSIGDHRRSRRYPVWSSAPPLAKHEMILKSLEAVPG